MRLLADLHISPRTVEFIRALGHDVIRVSEVLPANSTDERIVAYALTEQRVILTQDLDFSSIVALSGKALPSLLILRLTSSRIEHVNSVLERILLNVENDLATGAIVTVKDKRIRRRRLPIE